jgi:adenylosuccinate synthase
MSREAWVVVDLGFGDAGKGSITDFLCRDRGAGLVVRFNGGAQAGHNVVEDGGRHHTFSQFGAGLFAGAHTALGPDFVLHPLGMWMEAQHLEAIGAPDCWAKTQVDSRVRLITPFQQEAGRAREILRGDAAHGTCGVGVGECVGDSLAHPDDTIRVADLRSPGRVRRKLEQQRDRKRAELRALADGRPLPATTEALFADGALVDRVLGTWGDVASRLRVRSTEQVLARIAAEDRVVFEGAQGVLLDETWGFHPHTTWSDCTPAGALRLAGDRPVTRLGVTRSYAVRHGPGPFPTERAIAADEVHNDGAGWQGPFRTGALDAVLLRYAIEVCGGIDALAVTCLDQLSEGSCCDGYAGETGLVRALIPGPADDLGHRERLGAWLRRVQPVLAEASVLDFLAGAVAAPVALQSWGPTAAGKRHSRPWPPRL